MLDMIRLKNKEVKLIFHSYLPKQTSILEYSDNEEKLYRDAYSNTNTKKGQWTKVDSSTKPLAMNKFGVL